MKISTGLFAHIVLQRTRRNVSEARFAGTCSAQGRVVARVTRQGQVVRGFEGKKLGLAGGGRFKGTLAGLPAGGPYSIALTIRKHRRPSAGTNHYRRRARRRRLDSGRPIQYAGSRGHGRRRKTRTAGAGIFHA